MIKSVARTISTRSGASRIAIRRPLARSETMSVLSSRPLDFGSKPHPLPSLSFLSRQFSSSPSQQELLDVVGRELAEEEESESTTMPDDLLSLKEQLAADWSFVEDEGTVRMIRKGGVAKVAVVFHCQDTLEDPGYDDSVEEEENQEIEASPAVRFTLTVSKAGKTMVFKCLSEEATAVVESMAVTMEDLETIHSTGAVDDKYYQGPEFTELEEDFQDALVAYVREECGIDEDVAAFISMYADFKEQNSYVNWMKQVKSILE